MSQKATIKAEVSRFLSLSCNKPHETQQVFWPRSDFSPKLLHWLHSVIEIWPAPVKIELIYRSPSFPITLITLSDTLIWMGERHVRLPIGVLSPKCFMCKGDVRRKVSIDSTLKWLLTFLGWSLFMGSQGRYTERVLFFFIFNSYLTIPFGISSRGNPEGNQSDLQDEIELAYLFKRNRSVIRRYWILG